MSSEAESEPQREGTHYYTPAWEGPQDWVDEGLCRGQGARSDRVFFPERGGSTREAKTMCRQCPVQPQCLNYALRTNQKFGIWGGTTERERNTMRRKLRLI